MSPQESRDFFPIAKSIDRRIPATNATLEDIAKLIRFSDDVAGKVIIDVGGGSSTAVSELRAKGAIAFAFDPKYTHLPSLRNLSRLNPSREYILNSQELFQRYHLLDRILLTPQALFGNCYAVGEAEQLPLRDGIAELVYMANVTKHFSEEQE